MSDKVFRGIIIILIIGFLGLFIKNANHPKAAAVGVSHPEQGRNHISEGEPHPAYNSDPPSSGPHYAGATAPISWGVYTQEVPDEIFLHNEEHGGVIITYQPDLAKSQLKKLQNLFAPPYSRKDFSPIKAIVTPRSKNKHLIELASWKYTLNLDKYDETEIVNFYLQHVSQSPESTAGPRNTPINQAR